METEHNKQLDVPSILIDENKQHIKISGNSIMADPVTFYYKYMDIFLRLESREVCLDICFENVDSKSSRMFLTLLYSLRNNINIEVLKINWYVEEDDFNMIEIVQYYKGILLLEPLFSRDFSFNMIKQKIDLKCFTN